MNPCVVPARLASKVIRAHSRKRSQRLFATLQSRTRMVADDYVHWRNLARESWLTELYVKRLRSRTDKPIVVVGIERTGAPYVWSIEAQKQRYARQNIFVDYFKYPSSNIGERKMAELVKDFEQRVLSKYSSLGKPLFVFVDASSRKASPASFVGDDGALSNEVPLSGVLKRNGLRVHLHELPFGSTKVAQKRLLAPDINITDAILLNPSRERSEPLLKSNGEIQVRYKRAPQNNVTITQEPQFKEMILAMVRELKGSRP